MAVARVVRKIAERVLSWSPQWIAGEATANLADQTDPGVAAYFKTIEGAGLSQGDAISPFSGVAFGSLLLAVKLMNGIPYSSLNPAAVTAALRSYKGPIPLGPAQIDCSGELYPSNKNVCSDYDQFYKYNGNGQWRFLPPGAQPGVRNPVHDAVSA